ncbi:hypothetical protein RRF57_007854 [Xylaria bambusicola]|uniref:Cytochrome P450 n=1 Tax=Xylaria bambusicola TaxID=326684 RepID=A0AAN7UGU2_9PEZI
MGPRLASFSELWLFKAAATGEMHIHLADICSKYGGSNSAGLVRVGPNELISSDPDVGRHMSATKVKRRKGQWYASMKVDPYVDNIFSQLDPVKHDKLRACMSQAFLMKENPHLSLKIDGSIASFVNLIQRKYLSTSENARPIDLGLVSQYFSLDVITAIAFGAPLGYLDNDQDLFGYVKTTDAILPFVTLCSSSPSLGWFMSQAWVTNLVGPSPQDKTGQGVLMALAQKYVGERYGSDSDDKQDMVSLFLRNGMSRRQVESEILAQMSSMFCTSFAGSDTTSTAVRSIFLFIISNPRVYALLQAEIDDRIRNKRISSPITDDEARDMPYLQACIQEGLRIWPPFTGMMFKQVNPGGEVIKGTFVPGGTAVDANFEYKGHCGWGMQRGPEFGNDVEVFRPERWIEANQDQRKIMDRTVDIVFGSGRWACLGKAIVRAELNKVFVELLRRFDMSVVDPSKPWDSKNYTVFVQNKMWVRITERKSFG